MYVHDYARRKFCSNLLNDRSNFQLLPRKKIQLARINRRNQRDEVEINIKEKKKEDKTRCKTCRDRYEIEATDSLEQRDGDGSEASPRRLI